MAKNYAESTAAAKGLRALSSQFAEKKEVEQRQPQPAQSLAQYTMQDIKKSQQAPAAPSAKGSQETGLKKNPYQGRKMNELYQNTVERLVNTPNVQSTKGLDVLSDAKWATDRFASALDQSVNLLGGRNLQGNPLAAAQAEYERAMEELTARYQMNGLTAADQYKALLGGDYKTERQIEQENDRRILERAEALGYEPQTAQAREAQGQLAEMYAWRDYNEQLNQREQSSQEARKSLSAELANWGANAQREDVFGGSIYPALLAYAQGRGMDEAQAREMAGQLYADLGAYYGGNAKGESVDSLAQRAVDRIDAATAQAIMEGLNADYQGAERLEADELEELKNSIAEQERYVNGITLNPEGVQRGAEEYLAAQGYDLEWARRHPGDASAWADFYGNLGQIAQTVAEGREDELTPEQWKMWQEVPTLYTEDMLSVDQGQYSRYGERMAQKARQADGLIEAYAPTAYQQQIVKAYRNTLEGATEYLKESKGTDRERAAKDNLWMVESREKFAQVPKEAEYQARSQYDADASMPDNVRQFAYEFINTGNNSLDLMMKMDVRQVSGLTLDNEIYRDYMTPEEKATWTYLNNVGRYDDADAYLQYLSYDLSARKNRAAEAWAQDLAGQGVLGAIGASALSVPYSLARGAGYLQVAAGGLLQGLGISDAPINYEDAFSAGKFADSLRNSVLEHIDSDVWKFVYQTGMSGIDSALAGVAGGAAGSTWLGAALLGTGSAENTMEELKERGANDNQIFVGGTVAGIFETLFEKMSIGKFYDEATTLSKGGFKNALKNIGAQAGINLSEEFNTELADIVFDNAFMGKNSKAARKVDEYVRLGMDEEEAKRTVAGELAMECLEAGLGGALMGAGFGAVSSTASAVGTASFDKKTGGNFSAETKNTLWSLAESMPGTKAAELASKHQAPKATNRQVGQVYREIMAELPTDMRETLSHTMLRDEQMRALFGAEEGHEEAAAAFIRLLGGEELDRADLEALSKEPDMLGKMQQLLGMNEQQQTEQEAQRKAAETEEAWPALPEGAEMNGGPRRETGDTGTGTEANAQNQRWDMRQLMETEGTNGEKIKIRRVELDEDTGLPVATLENGETMAVEDMDISDRDNILLNAAADMDQEAGQILVQNAAGAEAVGEYARGMKQAYSAGYAGKALENVNSAQIRALDQNMAQQMWDAGRRAGAREESSLDDEQNRLAETGARHQRRDKGPILETVDRDGRGTTVRDVEMTEDGTAEATLEDGRKQNIDELSVSDEEKTLLFEAAQMEDQDAAADMIRAWNEAQEEKARQKEEAARQRDAERAAARQAQEEAWAAEDAKRAEEFAARQAEEAEKARQKEEAARQREAEREAARRAQEEAWAAEDAKRAEEFAARQAEEAEKARLKEETARQREAERAAARQAQEEAWAAEDVKRAEEFAARQAEEAEKARLKEEAAKQRDAERAAARKAQEEAWAAEDAQKAAEFEARQAAAAEKARLKEETARQREAERAAARQAQEEAWAAEDAKRAEEFAARQAEEAEKARLKEEAARQREAERKAQEEAWAAEDAKRAEEFAARQAEEAEKARQQEEAAKQRDAERAAARQAQEEAWAAEDAQKAAEFEARQAAAAEKARQQEEAAKQRDAEREAARKAQEEAWAAEDQKRAEEYEAAQAAAAERDRQRQEAKETAERVENALELAKDMPRGQNAAQDYAWGFKRVYEAARADKPIQSLYGDMLTESQRQAAQRAGERARERRHTELKEKNQAAAKADGFQAVDLREDNTGKTGLYYAEVSARVTDQRKKVQLRLIDAFARETGMMVCLYDTLGDQNGSYRQGTNVVSLALDAEEGALTRTVSHEGYHYLTQWSPGHALKIKNFVLDYLRGAEGYDLAGRMKQLTDRYSQAGQKLTPAQIEEEIVADSLLDVIGTEENVKKLVKQDQTLGEKIAEWAGKTFERLQGLIQRFARRSQEAAAMLRDAGTLQKAQEMFRTALQNARQNSQTALIGSSQAVRKDADIQQYQQDMKEAVDTGDAKAALNGLIGALYNRAERAWMEAHPEQYEEGLRRFQEALRAYVRTTNPVALSVALELQGLDAQPESMNQALTYAARQLMESDKWIMDEPGERFDLKEDQITIYDYSKSFGEQVEDWLQNKIPENDSLLVGGTPNVFQQIGASNLPVTIDQTHVDYAVTGKDAPLDDHNMGVEMLKKLPEMLEKPVAIIESVTRPNDSVVAIVQGEVNGHQMTAAVEIGGFARQNNRRMNVNRITSIQGRKNAVSKLLTDAITKETSSGNEVGVYFIDKKAAESLYENEDKKSRGSSSQAVSRVQFPGSALRDGLIHSIFDAGSPVNKFFMEQTETLQFDHWFEGSKVVNADGSPKIVFHGSGEAFTAFDKGRQGQNYRESEGGFFFTDRKRSAENYAALGNPETGGRLYEVYLSIRKPLELVAPSAMTAADYYDMHNADLMQDAQTNGNDGIIIHSEEGGNLYVAFEPEQIKSATDNIGTFDRTNPDIRYDLKADEDGIVEDVKDDADLYAQAMTDEEIQDALRDAGRLLDYAAGLTGQMRTGTEWKGWVREIAQKAIQETGSKIGLQRLQNQLSKVYEAIDQGGYQNGEILIRLRELGKEVLEKAPGTVEEMDENTRAAREALKSSPFYLTEAQKGAIRERYGSAQTFMRRMFGKTKIRNQAQSGQAGAYTSLEEYWRETLNPLLPGVFQEDTNPLDMPEILDAWLENSGKKKYSAVFGANIDRYATSLGLEMLGDYLNAPWIEENVGKIRANLVYDALEAESKAEEYRRKMTAMQESYRSKTEGIRENYKEKYQERIQRDRERRQNTEERQKKIKEIQRNVKSINTMTVNPTNQRHVPEELRGAAIAAVRPFLSTTSVFNRGDLDRLSTEYAALMEREGEIAGLDKDMQAAIQGLPELLEGKRLSQLSNEELSLVEDVVGNLKKIITEQNQATIDGRETTVDNLSQDMKDTMRAKGDAKRSAVAETLRLLGLKEMTPIYFADHVGGALKDMLLETMNGENRWAFIAQAAQEYANEQIRNYHVNQWINDKTHLIFTTQRGEKIELDRGLALSLYALWKRETTNKTQNALHLRVGGFTYDKSARFKGIDTYSPHILTKADMAQVMNFLGREQMEFADKMVEYLSTTLADEGNKVSMALYGYKKFKEGYYFPYQTDKSYLVGSLIETGERATTPANKGMTKATLRNAATPIQLKNFFDVWGGHVNDMGLYAGFAQAVDLMNRVLNDRISAEVSVDENGEYKVVPGESNWAILRRALGDEGVNYLKTFVRDVSGGVRADERGSLAAKGLSRMKKASVAANLSVALQQPTAYARAMMVMNPRYLLTVNPAKLKTNIENMYKYSGVAIIKDMGRFDTGTGKGAVEWITDGVQEKSKYKRFMEKLDDVTGIAAEKADEWTWGLLWGAVENEVKDTNTDVSPGTEEFYRAVAERFNDVVRHTQVYDSVMSKSEIMRSKSTMDKMVTSFMAEPTLTVNMLADAFRNIKAPGGGRKALRALGVFLANAALTALAKSIMTATRRKDDEGRTWGEKYLAEAAGNFTQDISIYGLMGMIPWARDVVSLLEGYSVERNDLDAVETLVKAYKTLNKDNAETWDKLQAIVGAVGNVVGVPAKNIMRDTEAIIRNLFLGGSASESTSPAALKYSVLDSIDLAPITVWDAEKKAYYGRMADALIAGNAEQYEELRQYMENTNREKPDTVKNGVKAMLKERAQSGSISMDQAARLLEDLGEKSGDAYFKAKGWIDGEDKYEDFEEAVKTGQKLKETINLYLENGVSASTLKSRLKDLTQSGDAAESRAKEILEKHLGMSADDSYWTVKEWLGGEDWKKYGDFWRAVNTGSALRATIKTYTDHGATNESLAAEITKHFKEEYIQLYKTNKAAAANLKARLLTAYEALGYDRDKKNKDIDKWLNQ